MDQDHLKISINLDDANCKQRCNERMEELKNTRLPNHDATSQQKELLHKQVVGKKKFMSSELYKTVKNGNVDTFVDMLEDECTRRQLLLSDISDQVTGTDDSLLHVAAEMGRVRIAELICDHFPELLIRRNIRGDTALHAAVRSKNSTIVKLMLSQYAIEMSKHDRLKDKKITREKNEYGDTPLHEAVYSGNFNVVQELFCADEEVVHYLNKARQSPLYLAVVTATGNKEILNLLLQIPFPTDQLCLGNSPLHAAIWERKPAVIKEILMKKPEVVYLRDEDVGTPLHYAAYVGYVEGFRMLLENSLEKSDQTVFERNKKGHLPIHLACKKGHVQVVKIFLQHEWPINPFVLLNQKGQNILHVAAKNGKSNVVRFLLRNQKIDEVTINQKDFEGNTPLHLASTNCFPKVMYFLTQDRRTNAKLINNKYFTAKDIVDQTRHTQWRYRKFLAGQVLKHFEVPLKENDMLRSQIEQRLKAKSRVNIELFNTLLVAATLIVTVTFAAAFTVPGGVYSSDDPNPENRGMAVFAHKTLFRVFTICNTIAMYSSVIACGSIVTSILAKLDFLHLVVPWLSVSFLTLPVAFWAAVRLVVANNSELVFMVTVIGVMHTLIILFGLLWLLFPTGIHLPLLRQLGRFVLLIRIASVYHEDKLVDLTSRK